MAKVKKSRTKKAERPKLGGEARADVDISLPRKPAEVPVSQLLSEEMQKLSKKKKLNKKEAALAEYHPNNSSKQRSKLVAAVLAPVRIETGNFRTRPGSQQVSVGLRVPSFSVEYLLQNIVLIFERVLQLVGLPGTCKSALVFELMRWFITNQGVGYVLEHESKYSDDWGPSIIGWENADSFGVLHCNSMDDWQSYLQYLVRETLAEYRGTVKEPGPGEIFPMIMAVDSMVGKSLMESQDKIAAEGSAGRAHPIEALSINNFLKAFPGLLVNHPFLAVFVNHLKMHKEVGQHVAQRKKQGGLSKEFQETIEWEMKRIGELKTTKADGTRLRIKCEKSSAGTGFRSIPVNIMWWNDYMIPGDETTEWMQHTVWDWHGSTIELLLTMEPHEQKIWKEVLDLRKVSERNLVWSDALSIPEDTPVPYYVAGERIMQTDAVINGLRKGFGVKRGVEFQYGVDYQQQIKDELGRLEKRQVIRAAKFSEFKKKEKAAKLAKPAEVAEEPSVAPVEAKPVKAKKLKLPEAAPKTQTVTRTVREARRPPVKVDNESE